MERKSDNYFKNIHATIEEEEPSIIKAYYELRKREEEFAE
jgi:hypothetical protein